MHLSFFYTILLPEQTNLPNPMYCIHLSFFNKHVLHPATREGAGDLSTKGVIEVPAGPVGKRTVEAVGQLSCKTEKTGGRSQLRWSMRCRVPPGSRVTATVPGAGQQLGEVRHRASGVEEQGIGHGIELQWCLRWRFSDGDDTVSANFASLTA
jgi:hypothetical protein